MQLHRTMMWVECNYPEDTHPKGRGGEDRLSNIMRVAQKMDNLHVIPIVTTQPGYEALVYTSLSNAVPNVIGGSKSSHWRLSGDDAANLTNPLFWRRVAQHVETLYNYAGGPVVLDNESLFQHVLTTPGCLLPGTLAAMTAAIQKAKFRRTVWMAGVNVLEGDRERAWSAEVVEAVVRGMPDTTQWITPFWAWGPLWKDQLPTLKAAALMSQIKSPDKWVPILFGQPDGVWPARDDSGASVVWNPQQFVRAESDPEYAYGMVLGKRKHPIIGYAGDETEEFVDLVQKTAEVPR